MKGDHCGMTITKTGNSPVMRAYDEIREMQARSLLGYVCGIAEPDRIEDDEKIVLSGVATKDPPNSTKL